MQVCNRFLVKSWSFCMQTGTRSKNCLKMRESYWMAYLLTGNLLGAFSTWLIIADIVYTYNIGGSDQPIFMDKPGSSHLEAAFRILRSIKTSPGRGWFLPILHLSSYFYIDFIKAVDYFEWISNIVLVPKKDGRVRVCINFKNIIKACSQRGFSAIAHWFARGQDYCESLPTILLLVLRFYDDSKFSSSASSR